MYRIMLVDDDENILNALQRVLKRQKNWKVESFVSPVEALQRASTHSFDVIISDYRMPDMNGAELLGKIKELQPQSVRMVLSGYADLESVLNAINQAEIYRFVSKPWQDYELITVICKALEHREILQENKVLADQVRAQQQLLDKHKSILEHYQKKHPGLLKVEWLENGGIKLSDEESDV